MQVTEIKNDGLIREYKVALPAAEIGAKLDARLNELARTVKLPGFRPGKVPLALVRQRFGQSLRGEVLEQVISESSQTVIAERNLRPAGTPQLSISAYDDGADLEYSLAVEVMPDVVLPDYGQISLERLVAEPDDSDVEAVLTRLAAASRQFDDAGEGHAAVGGDVAIVDFVGPADRKAFVGSDGEAVPIEVGAGGPLPGVGEQLLGAAVGDRRPLSVTYPPDYAIADLRGLTANYEVEIKQLRSAAPVAIDDDLAKRFGFDDLATLRAEVRQQRADELKSLARLRMKRALLDRLAELYAFDVPQVLLTREYEGIVRQMAAVEAQEEGSALATAEPHVHDETCGHDHDHEHDHHHEHDHEHAAPASDAPASNATAAAADAALTEEQRAEYRHLAERRVRLGLVLAEVGRQSHLKVTPEELSRAMVNEARRFPGQEKDVIAYFRQHAPAREALAAPILEDKVVDYIVELATVTERRISAEELLRAVEETPMSTSQAGQ